MIDQAGDGPNLTEERTSKMKSVLAKILVLLLLPVIGAALAARVFVECLETGWEMGGDIIEWLCS